MDSDKNKHQVRAPFMPRIHDHAHCIDGALSRADRQCREKGQRLTTIRRRVLSLILQNHEPVKAYDLLAQLREDNPRAAPPTVYRALDFLQEEGFVHRIATLNAFVACGEPGDGHGGQFLICSDCGAVAELDDNQLSESIKARAAALGFSVMATTLEVSGRCRECLGQA